MSFDCINCCIMKVFLIGVICLLSICNGSPTSRIAGGNVTPISQHPYAVSLLNNLDGGSFRQLCGGTILSNNAILSAASCFFTGTSAHENISWRVRVGSSYSNSGGLVYNIRRITTHPDFQTTTRVNDVAVLRTTMNVVYGINVQAAYLAGGNHQVANGAAVTALGWGVTSSTADLSSELRQVQIWVVNQETCASRYSNLGFTLTDNMLCAGWLNVGVRGQCHGDTGGPLLYNNVVVGVFSWSESCASYQYPSINTRVSAYSRWIESTAVAA